MIFPEFLYDNVIRGIVPTFTGTTITGKEPANSYDWRDFSLFEANTGTLDFVMTSDSDISAFSAYVADFTGTGTESIVLQYESSPAVFTTLVTVNPAGGKLSFDKFTEVTVLTGRKIRFLITAGTGALDIRQLGVGVPLVSEQGDYMGTTDPTLLNGVKVSNTIAINGSIIGRSIKRLERTGNLQLDNLTPAFVRGEWQTFARHAAKFPCVYIQNFRDYPDSIAFSTFELQTATPSGVGDRMNLSGKIRSPVSDELAL